MDESLFGEGASERGLFVGAGGLRLSPILGPRDVEDGSTTSEVGPEMVGDVDADGRHGHRVLQRVAVDVVATFHPADLLGRWRAVQAVAGEQQRSLADRAGG